jgi:hypothetical protein
MEVTPVVIEMGPVVGVTISVAITATAINRRCAKTTAAENGSCAKAATVDRDPTASESAAVKCRAAATETTRHAASAEPAWNATTAETATAASAKSTTSTRCTAVLNLDRQVVRYQFC